MFSKHVLIFCIFILIFKQIKCDKELDIRMMQDFLNYDNSSVGVYSFLCWNKEDKIYLSEMIFNQNIHLSIFSTEHTIMYVHNSDTALIFMLDLDCGNSWEILVQANKQNLYKPPNKWLILTEDPNIFQRFENAFIELHIFVDSDVIVGQKINNTYVLTEIYRFAPYRKELIQRVIMNWTEREHFGKYRRRHLASERRDLDGTMVKSSIVLLSNDTLQNNHLEDYRNKHIDPISKVNYKFTCLLVDFVNATTQYYPVNTWGYIDKKNNSYTGMIGFMERNEVEIGGTALFMIGARLAVIDYVSMTTPTKIRFIFRPPPLSYQSNIFTLPFSSALWFSCIALIILFQILLYFAVYIEWHHFDHTESDNSLPNSFLAVAMFIWSAVAQQGDPCEPRSGTGKIIMILAFISFMFLCVSYSANIVALLQSSADNINTLEDLLESRLKLGVDDNVYNRFYFETATEPIQKAIYQKKIAPPGQQPNFLSMAEGVKLIRRGFFAFHMELGPAYQIIGDTFLESEKCGLQEITYLQVVDTYFSLKKNSIYKEIFKIGLRKIYDSGLQNRELLKYYMKKPECQSGGGSFVSVGLIDSYPAFLFLAGGIALSIVLFLLEIIANNRGILK